MLINLRNALMGGKRLPYDAEVEFLESTGTQYINTGLNYFADFEVGIKLRTSVPNKALGTGVSTCLQRYSANNPYWDLGISGRSYRSSASIVDYHVMSWKGGVFAADGVTVHTVSNPFMSGAMTLFGAGGMSYPNMIYACKLWDTNGALVRDYIPVRKGTVGYLYDRVSGKLFGNAGTGDFVLGPDVVPVEYLESSRTQYIDTDFVPDNTSGIRISSAPMAKADVVHCGCRSTTAGRWWVNFGSIEINAAWNIYQATGILYNVGTFYDIELNYLNSRNFRVDGVIKNTALYENELASTTDTATLFAAKTSGVVSLKASCRIKSVLFSKGQSVVRRYLPVRVGTEGAMMDVLTRRIYRNAGTGAFTYGNDLKYPIPAA